MKYTEKDHPYNNQDHPLHDSFVNWIESPDGHNAGDLTELWQAFIAGARYGKDTQQRASDTEAKT